jgi:hypothetical protein
MDLPDDIGYGNDLSIFVIFRVNAGAAPGSYHIILGGGQLEFSVNQDSTSFRNGIYAPTRYVQNDGSLIADDTWVMAGITHGSNLKKSYINGAYVAQQSTTGAVSTSFTRRLGRYGTDTGYYLVGDIATVIAYNRVLTTDEIEQNFNALKGRFGF